MGESCFGKGTKKMATGFTISNILWQNLSSSLLE
ncbi:unnamed protein product [Tenebrio molitor]|nr:unnamed protein product [Tenebrio molitor]